MLKSCRMPAWISDFQAQTHLKQRPLVHFVNNMFCRHIYNSTYACLIIPIMIDMNEAALGLLVVLAKSYSVFLTQTLNEKCQHKNG